jgi:hypothetical protein
MGVTGPQRETHREPIAGDPITYRSDTGRVFVGVASEHGLTRIAGEWWVHVRVPDLFQPTGAPTLIVVPLARCDWRRP